MYIIAGLGNPGIRYRGTRHNMGFEVIDRLAKEYGIEVGQRKMKALIGSGMIRGEKVLLVKPQTFMNLSGESLREITDYYHVAPDHLLVICDDINLSPGQLRLRAGGSAGGHNGLKNIILHCGTQDFPRIRVGVGEKPARLDLIDYVLMPVGPEDEEAVREGLDEAARAAAEIIGSGMEAAMNRFNRRKTPKTEQSSAATEEK